MKKPDLYQGTSPVPDPLPPRTLIGENRPDPKARDLLVLYGKMGREVFDATYPHIKVHIGVQEGRRYTEGDLLRYLATMAVEEDYR